MAGWELTVPNGITTIFDSITKRTSTIKNKKLEGKLLPEGSIVKLTVHPNGFFSGPGIDTTKPQGQASFTRTIKYGITPELNDTSYTRSNYRDLGIIDPKIGFNNYYYKQK